MDRVLQSWRDASKARKLGWILLALGVVGIGAYPLILGPIRARTAALESRLGGLQREAFEAQAAVAALTLHRAEMVELEKRLDLLQQRLPVTREIPALYRALYGAATETGLAVGLFQPGEPRGREYYTEIPIAVTTQGTFHRLRRFLARIAALSSVVTVESLKLTGVEHPTLSLRAEMILTAYVYRSAGSPPPKSGIPRPPMPSS
jgi:Tfp pilus assembly protein PilO